MVKNGNIDYSEFQEIVSDQTTRQTMVNIVNQDSKDNSHEYGGVVNLKNNEITEVSPVGNAEVNFDRALNASQQTTLDQATSYVTFHDHSSEQKDFLTQTSGGSEYQPNNARMQFASPGDISNFGKARESYAFGMGKRNATQGGIGGGGQTVYIYNAQGIQATLPLNYFVNSKK